MTTKIPSQSIGKVFLVGAGPGDPELLTLKAIRCLESAEVVVHDALIDQRVMQQIPQNAIRIDAGKRCGKQCMNQEQISKTLVDYALAGYRVVRLKGGDPFMFGRGGEEALMLAEAGVTYEVVPGISSGIAVPAYAGIPITHRGVASSVTFVTGHPGSDAHRDVDWAAIAKLSGTIVIFMGLGALEDIAEQLMSGGRQPSTPACAVSDGTMPTQRIVVSTLGELPARVREAALPSPTLIVIGEVVALQERLAWILQSAKAA